MTKDLAIRILSGDVLGTTEQTQKAIAMAVQSLEEAPTVDIPEVVRCKECFYAIPYNEKWTLPKKNNCMWCKRYEDIRTPDWFCADGERREDDAEVR